MPTFPLNFTFACNLSLIPAPNLITSDLPIVGTSYLLKLESQPRTQAKIYHNLLSPINSPSIPKRGTFKVDHRSQVISKLVIGQAHFANILAGPYSATKDLVDFIPYFTVLIRIVTRNM